MNICLAPPINEGHLSKEPAHSPIPSTSIHSYTFKTDSTSIPPTSINFPIHQCISAQKSCNARRIPTPSITVQSAVC